MQAYVKSQDGFSLMNLVFVLVVIGVIIAVIVPVYGKYTKRAREAMVTQNMQEIKEGIDLYAIDQLGSYPHEENAVRLEATMPDGEFPENPFTSKKTKVVWNVDPESPGDVAIYNLPGGGYMVKGYGEEELLPSPIIVGD